MIVEYKHAEMPNEDDTVWRYMALDKFEDLLRRRKMYFRRIDLLDDQFEGAYTNLHIPPLAALQHLPENVRSLTFSDRHMQVALGKDNRKFCYVNCWSVNPYESNVMWGAYLRGQPGVAIQTTYKNLKMAFDLAPEKIIAGKVHYLDYNAETILERDGIMPCMCKRMSFVDERELRLFNWNIDEVIFSETQKGYETRDGLLIEAELASIIGTVHLYPKADAAFRQQVESLLRQCGGKAEVFPSELASGPTS